MSRSINIRINAGRYTACCFRINNKQHTDDEPTPSIRQRNIKRTRFDFLHSNRIWIGEKETHDRDDFRGRRMREWWIRRRVADRHGGGVGWWWHNRRRRVPTPSLSLSLSHRWLPVDRSSSVLFSKWRSPTFFFFKLRDDARSVDVQTKETTAIANNKI